MNKVINFHDVYNGNWFEQTLLIIKKRYNFISIEDLDKFYYDKKKLRNSCLITVDDGDKTFYDVMFPVLLKHQIPSILFVSPKIIISNKNFWFQEIRDFDKWNLNKIISCYFETELRNYPNGALLKNCMIYDIWSIINEYKKQTCNLNNKHFNMNVSQLKEVHESKIVKIGAHTQNHPILRNENRLTSKKEIEESVKELEGLLNEKIYYFAYPNGIPKLDFGEREIAFLKDKGIRLAFSTKPDNLSFSYSPFEIPRFGISHGTPSFVILKLILGKYWEIIKNLRSTSDADIRNELQTKLQFIRKPNP